MDQEKTITVNIVNRSYPPGPSITGESAAELARYLEEKNIIVNVIHVDASYQGGATGILNGGKVYTIKTFYNGKNKLFRLLGNVYEGFCLIKKAKRLPADVVICMTDPPLLNMWASLLLSGKKKWMLWSMDLYPEAFVAGKLVKENNPLFRIIHRIVKKNPPDHVISLGPCQDTYIKEEYKWGKESAVLPCGIFDAANIPKSETPQWAANREKIYIGYCGNLGEAHSLPFLKAIIDNFDPEKFHFILSVYGSKATEILRFAKDKPGITILPTVKRNELAYIDLHLASLTREWQNVCVPSKTVSSVCAGSSFLFYGYPDSDNWTLLQQAGWIINDQENLENTVSSFLTSLTKEMISEKKHKANILAASLNESKQMAFQKVHTTIRNMALYRY